ncbi:hypothetical protein FHX64_002762 [Microbacter margulisiae]|uniref:Uncharacterized protein n=1 Tax=Microbacter margulisiae TaxID=1350067 RepID=A0A7W5DT37_9PORP|nr:hypothetical protein [Microbacter margulisiae]
MLTLQKPRKIKYFILELFFCRYVQKYVIEHIFAMRIDL